MNKLDDSKNISFIVVFVGRGYYFIVRFYINFPILVSRCFNRVSPSFPQNFILFDRWIAF